jgi:hypothetical protein
MPVRKFHSVEEMRREQWIHADDPRLPDVIRTVWQWGWEMAGRYMPPRGIFKFRSIEEAGAHRRAWEDQRIAVIKKGMQKVTSDHAE